MASALENRCPICLESWEEASYVMPCLHQFCYPCILRWAESKPECPLCKRRVSSILHSVRADNDFREHPITPPAAHTPAEATPGQTAARSLHAHAAAQSPAPVPTPTAPVGGFHVYMWAFIFRRYPSALQPLRPWLRRELVLILEDAQEAESVQGSVLASLRYFGLHEEALTLVLRDALGRHTETFVRRLIGAVVLLCRREAQLRMGLGDADAEEREGSHTEEREGSHTASRGRASAASSEQPGGPSSSPSAPGPTSRAREEPEEAQRSSRQAAGARRRRRDSSPGNHSRPRKRPRHGQ